MGVDFVTEFSAYLALGFILFAIRHTKTIPNKWLPIIALVLGVLYAAWEAHAFTPPAFLNGCQYALLGLGSVATVQYFLDSKKKKK